MIGNLPDAVKHSEEVKGEIRGHSVADGIKDDISSWQKDCEKNHKTSGRYENKARFFERVQEFLHVEWFGCMLQVRSKKNNG